MVDADTPATLPVCPHLALPGRHAQSYPEYSINEQKADLSPSDSKDRRGGYSGEARRWSRLDRLIRSVTAINPGHGARVGGLSYGNADRTLRRRLASKRAAAGAEEAGPVSEFAHDADVVIVGSGAAGLVAALVVAERGLRAVVAEKSER